MTESVYHPGAQPPTRSSWSPPLADLPPAGPASFWLAEMYVALNRNYDQALQLTQSTIAQQPNFKEAYTLLSYIYNKLGREKEAREAERQAEALPSGKEGS